MNAGPQNLLQEVSDRLDTLRKSDRRVAELVLSDAAAAASMKLSQMARAAEVSEPTVMRFCAAVGCGGFQDFKLRLTRCLALGVPPSHAAIARGDTLADLVRKIFDYNLSNLDWARSHLPPEALGKAVRLLAAARSITFIGFGASAIVAGDAQQKFPLFGVPCAAPSDPHQMLMAATMMSPGDALVAISNTGRTRDVVNVAREARGQGAGVIAISGADGPLARHCDVGIKVETLENTDLYTPAISRVAALVVIDILATAVSLARDEAHQLRVADMKRRLAKTRAGGVG